MAIKSKERLWAETLDHIPTTAEVREQFPKCPTIKLNNMLTILKKAFPDRPLGVQGTMVPKPGIREQMVAPELTVPQLTMAPIELTLSIGEAGVNLKLRNGQGHIIGTLQASPTGLKVVRPNAKSTPERELPFSFIAALHDAQLGH